MEVTPISTGANTRGSSGQASGALSSDFETFLAMLTTQMENQDPLNPIESSDFAVQLATFSGVEQQVRTNDLLARMSAGAEMADLASWVGLDARVSGAVDFDGSPVRIDTGAERPAQSRNLVVRTESGTLVSSESLPSGSGVLEWVGRDDFGNPLPNGRYTLSIEHVRDGDVIDTVEAGHFSRILEARRTGTGTELLLAGGRTVPADQVEAVRQGNS